MLLELTLKNFKSFRDETTISLASGKTSKRRGNLLSDCNGDHFVKALAFYGPNASGKTTVLDALFALSSFVAFSAQDQKPTELIRLFEAFALDDHWRKQPVEISVTMCLQGERYKLSVAATRERVWREVLTVQQSSKKKRSLTPPKVLIDRTWNEAANQYTIKLDEQMGPDLTREAARAQTTPNRLILGKFASLNSEVARRVLEWFDRDLDFYDLHRNESGEEWTLSNAARMLKEDRAFADLVSRFMRDADIGLQRVRVVDEKMYEAVSADMENKFELVDRVRPAFSFQHATEDGSEAIPFGTPRSALQISSGLSRAKSLDQPIVR